MINYKLIYVFNWKRFVLGSPFVVGNGHMC